MSYKAYTKIKEVFFFCFGMYFNNKAKCRKRIRVFYIDYISYKVTLFLFL